MDLLKNSNLFNYKEEKIRLQINTNQENNNLNNEIIFYSKNTNILSDKNLEIERAKAICEVSDLILKNNITAKYPDSAGWSNIEDLFKIIYNK